MGPFPPSRPDGDFTAEATGSISNAAPHYESPWCGQGFQCYDLTFGH